MNMNTSMIRIVAIFCAAFVACASRAGEDAPASAELSRSRPEVFEGVLAGWPKVGKEYYTSGKYWRGEVQVGFSVGPDGWVYAADPFNIKAKRKLAREGKQKGPLNLWEDFDREGATAMLQWGFRMPADVCAISNGRQVFTFDGAAAEPTGLGATELALAADVAAVDEVLPSRTFGVTLRKLEITGGKVYMTGASRIDYDAESTAGPRAQIEPLPPRRALATDAKPAILADWNADAFLAEIDQEEPRQLAILTFKIGADGKASDVQVAATIGPSGFAKSARKLVEGAKFVPAQRAGAAAEVRVCQSIGWVQHQATI